MYSFEVDLKFKIDISFYNHNNDEEEDDFF
jgi:hypothetical protein